ncbi:MAG: histidine utilization repressor [Hyphomicrobiales bacterium]|nr:histidine utilization repressor [Hyphomicrobiales bacterium]MBV9518116.1 histidine utilization repressor [Hyphomicrobiales bacterium]
MNERSQSVAADLANGTLHHRIRVDLEGKILSGEWPPGHRVPFEHELMAGYGCSRMTVNKVLSGLAAAGLIERRRRAGSFVRRPQFQSAVLQIHDIKAEVSERGKTYAYELLSQRRRKANANDREALSVGPEVGILALRCRHLADGRPFALEERLINLTAIPAGETIDFKAEPPGTWLLGHVPWTEAEHHISAREADAEMARRLEVAEGSACLVVRRRTWRSGETVTVVRLIFPGPSYHLVARFTPSQR